MNDKQLAVYCLIEAANLLYENAYISKKDGETYALYNGDTGEYLGHYNTEPEKRELIEEYENEQNNK